MWSKEDEGHGQRLSMKEAKWKRKLNEWRESLSKGWAISEAKKTMATIEDHQWIDILGNEWAMVAYHSMLCFQFHTLRSIKTLIAFLLCL